MNDPQRQFRRFDNKVLRKFKAFEQKTKISLQFNSVYNYWYSISTSNTLKTKHSLKSPCFQTGTPNYPHEGNQGVWRILFDFHYPRRLAFIQVRRHHFNPNGYHIGTILWNFKGTNHSPIRFQKDNSCTFTLADVSSCLFYVARLSACYHLK